MSTSYAIRNHYAAINRGRDDEFEVVCDVSFSVTPREARTSTYPGAEPEIVDIVVTLSQESKDRLLHPIPEAVCMIEEEIEEQLTGDPADLWDHVARQREACADYAGERR